VRRSLDRIEATFRDVLFLAKAKGELADSANISALARFITSGVQGLRLVGKANPSREMLEDVAGVMLKCLD
jgi:TetR/AcrR family transcriptional repressor of nem operon